MKELIPKDEYGVFADTKDTARVDSLFVAEFFEKEHFHVLRDISRITDTKSGLSKEFTASNFEPSTYKDKTGRKLPCHYMTRDGFTMLVMGYTGAKAMRFKELYIRRFNEMESFIKTLVSARQEFPLLTAKVCHGKVYWNCSTYLTYGKGSCFGKQIPEETLQSLATQVLDLPTFDAEIFAAQIAELEVPAPNQVLFRFADGGQVLTSWQDHSRRESWTEDMRQAARIRAIEQRRCG